MPAPSSQNISPETSRNLHAARRFILFTVFIYAIGFGIIMPSLPQLIMDLEGVGLPEATRLGGFIGATYAISMFICGPIVGNLSDRFGRRPVFIISLFAFAVDFLLMGFAPSVIWLFIGRSVAGGLGAIFGPANAAMADMTEGKDRAKSFGMVGAAFSVGFIIGPAVGGVLADFGTRVPFFVASGLALANCVYGLIVFPETMPKEARRSFSMSRANPLGALMNLKKIPSLLPIAAIFLVWQISTQIYPAVWAYFGIAQYGWSAKLIGLSFAVIGASMALTQIFLLGRLVARFGERGTALLAMAAGTCGYFVLAFLTNGIAALIFMFPVGLQSMAMPSINAMMSRRTPPDQQGELQGLNGSLTALSLLIAQLMFTYILFYFTSDAAGATGGDSVRGYFPGAPFVVAGGIGILAICGLLLLPKQDKGTQV